MKLCTCQSDVIPTADVGVSLPEQKAVGVTSSEFNSEGEEERLIIFCNGDGEIRKRETERERGRGKNGKGKRKTRRESREREREREHERDG